MKNIFVGMVALLVSLSAVSEQDADINSAADGETERYTGTVKKLIQQARVEKEAERGSLSSPADSAEAGGADNIIDFADSLKENGEKPYFVGMYREGNERVAKVYYMGVVGEYKTGQYLPNDARIELISTTEISVIKPSAEIDDVQHGRMYLTSVKRIGELRKQRDMILLNSYR